MWWWFLLFACLKAPLRGFESQRQLFSWALLWVLWGPHWAAVFSMTWRMHFSLSVIFIPFSAPGALTTHLPIGFVASFWIFPGCRPALFFCHAAHIQSWRYTHASLSPSSVGEQSVPRAVWSFLSVLRAASQPQSLAFWFHRHELHGCHCAGGTYLEYSLISS